MRIAIWVFLGLWLMLARAEPVAAQQRDSEFTVFGAYRFGGEVSVEDSSAVYAAEDSPGYGLIWNTRHQANTQWEVYFSQQQTEMKLSDPLLAEPPIDVNFSTLQLGGTYLLQENGVQPYIAMTLGGTHVRSDADSDTFFSGSLGLGLKVRPHERVGFRLEARLHGVLVRDSTKIFCQSGPSQNFCAVAVAGDMFAQFETFAGLTFRF
jgi:hypothetical protein